jgi:predicted nucleic acid-binding protein
VIVLDASAVVSILLYPGSDAEHIRERIEGSQESVHMPHLMDVEVLNVRRRHTLRGILNAGRGETALRDLSNLKMTRYPHTPLAERIWELRGNLTAYDAAYAALAEALDAPLVTTDGRLSRTPGHRARVELYS